jgi:hypothetical protein
MDIKIEYLCDRANVNEMKKIPAIYLPIKYMIIYLEKKIADYNNMLSFDNSIGIQHMKLRVMECILYLKKVQ